MPARGFTAFVLAASAVVLGAALLSEYWGGLAPCELCLMQRWPWGKAASVTTRDRDLCTWIRGGCVRGAMGARRTAHLATDLFPEISPNYFREL